jgi:isopentenyldiphosphate isomerase
MKDDSPSAAAAELVDIVDEENRTIGVLPRSQMRGRRLAHRCTYVLVFNGRGEIFIHLRTPTKDVFPSYWDVAVGGVLAAGESYEQGVRREVEEELGVQATPRELFLLRYEDARTVVFGMVYRLDHEGPFQLQAEEIVRGEWVALDEVWGRAQVEPFCPDGLEALREYQRRG